MKDLISLKSLEAEEILNLLDLADDIKRRHRDGKKYKPLLGRTVITSFPSTSLRT